MLLIEKQKKRFKTDLAPLIDVVFLLLIFFMLTFSVSGQGMDLSLPNGGSDEAENAPPLIVVIDHLGTIRIGEDVVALENLTSSLRQALKIRKSQTVSIQVDNKILYDLFVQVFDRARLAGAKNFSLAM